MAKNPAVLFYTSDFLTGVIGFTYEEMGQYIYLLCLQHQRGHLSKEFIYSAIPNINEVVLSKFCEDKNGLFFNKRMEEEKKKREKYSESRSKNRSKSVETKGKKENNTCKTYENDMKNISETHEEHMENENDNDNENINNNNLFNFIESNFGRTLNSIEYEEISNWEDNELTRYAITQAVLNGGYTINYIKTILNSYRLKGISTVLEAQKDDEDFQKKKLAKSKSDDCMTFQEKERRQRKQQREEYLRKHGELK